MRRGAHISLHSRARPPELLCGVPAAQVHEKESGEVDILTKGDNNAVDDRGLYAASQSWINKEHVIGRAKGYLPYIGMVTIIMNDYPMVKYILVGLMGLFRAYHEGVRASTTLPMPARSKYQSTPAS